jgi:hypothetical protein
MTQANVQRQSARWDPSQGYIPRQFNTLTRTRFLKSRRLRHLARVQGEPTDAQHAMARSMATLEWGALVGENDGSIRGLHEAREHRRLLLKIIDDFERSLAPRPAPPPAPASTEDILAGIHSRYGAPMR